MENNSAEILLVEDDKSDAELTMRVLKKNNFANRVLHAKDGAEAVELLFGENGIAGKGQNNLPKVILLDLKLPKLNGIEVLSRLKGDERTRGIPVVVLTSSREDKDLLKCYELGANSYIVKPVEFGAFSRAIAELGFYWLLLNEKNG